jgi:UDP-2,3-diacylglucosamine pyrophosphatase LpxH
MDQPRYDVVVISDLHMSNGYNARTGTFHRSEDFFYDGAFARFIDHLIARTETEPRRWRLVILGDFVDFLQVETPPSEHPISSSPSTITKLDIIARGHPGVFEAFGRFIAAGNLVDIVIGNHDIEWVWPEAQAHFRALVARSAGADVGRAITFHAWFLYLPGMAYLEHGHQYDSVNSFETLMRPFLPHLPDRIELPLGSFFVLYLFNYIEAIDPFADNVKPATRYLGWAMRNHPILALTSVGYYLQFFIRTLRKTSDLSFEEQAARRATYRREVVEPYAAAQGLSAAVVVEIDKLAAVPAVSSRWRQLKALFLPSVGPGLGTVAAIIATYRILRRLDPPARSLFSLALGAAALFWREQRMRQSATRGGGYLLLAANRIHELLAREDADVPAYIFGHTHHAEQYPLVDADHTPRYFNTGTWTPLVPQTFDLLGNRERFTFVQITHDPATGEVLPRLLIWNDAANRAEPLLLM